MKKEIKPDTIITYPKMDFGRREATVFIEGFPCWPGSSVHTTDCDHLTGDSIALHSISHPQRTSLWKRILTFWKRPKFSKDNIERNLMNKKVYLPAKEKYPLEHFRPSTPDDSVESVNS